MKLIWCGDRNWNNYQLIYLTMQILKDKLGSFTVIEGEANGADTLSRKAAEALGLEVEKYPANWNKHGKAAGPIRNTEMLKAGADGILAFHDDLSKSKGTKNMVEQALNAGLPVWISPGQGNEKLYEFMLELIGRKK